MVWNFRRIVHKTKITRGNKNKAGGQRTIMQDLGNKRRARKERMKESLWDYLKFVFEFRE